MLLAWITLSGWGYKGHEIIGRNSSLCFNADMTQFESWVAILTNHSGDADKRKSWDSNEGIKHYIDIDNFPEFIVNGKISQYLDSLISIHGRTFISDQGILPWATIRAYDTLVSYFQLRKFDEAALIAADLSHYVADGYMPLHITANYDGQLTGNKGIHSRYESTMISKYESEIKYIGGEIAIVENVPDYVFTYIYKSNHFVDSILNADNYAKSVNPSTSSTAYTAALWERTGDLTVSLFQNASFSLAELIYTAWVKAGSPSFDDHTFSEQLVGYSTMLNAVYYNDSLLNVEFGLNNPAEISCDILTLNGEKIESRVIGYFEKGLHQFNFKLNVPKGTYLFLFNYGGLSETQKFIVR